MALGGSVFPDTAAKCHLAYTAFPVFQTLRRRRCWLSPGGCGELEAWIFLRSLSMFSPTRGRAVSTATAKPTAAGGRP
jgi:hypothetical protein